MQSAVAEFRKPRVDDMLLIYSRCKSFYKSVVLFCLTEFSDQSFWGRDSEDRLSCSVSQSSVFLDAWTPSVGFWMVCGHTPQVMQALFISIVILRAVLFLSLPLKILLSCHCCGGYKQYLYACPQPSLLRWELLLHSTAQLYIMNSVDTELSSPPPIEPGSSWRWDARRLQSSPDSSMKLHLHLAGVFWSSDSNLSG